MTPETRTTCWAPAAHSLTPPRSIYYLRRHCWTCSILHGVALGHKPMTCWATTQAVTRTQSGAPKEMHAYAVERYVQLFAHVGLSSATTLLSLSQDGLLCLEGARVETPNMRVRGCDGFFTVVCHVTPPPPLSRLEDGTPILSSQPIFPPPQRKLHIMACSHVMQFTPLGKKSHTVG